MIKRSLFFISILSAIICIYAGCNRSFTKIDNNLGKDNTYTISISSYAPDSLNPIFTRNAANISMLNLIFEPLVYVDNQGKPVSGLAENWSPENGSLKWKIELKKGVTFSDQTALSSLDVKSSLESAKDLNSDSIYKENLSNIKSINIINDTQLEIDLNSPNVNFINLLSVPICKAQEARKISDFSPIGTGPYVYHSQTGEIIELIKNENYRNKKGGNISKIQVVLLPNKNVSSFAFDTKTIDILSGELIHLSKYKGNSESNMITIPTNNFHFLGINNEKIQSKALRQAINMGIDKKKLCDDIFLSQYSYTDNFISSDNFMYNQDLPSSSYDPKKAKQLLQLSEINEKSLKLELIVNKENELKCNTADFIALNLAENLNINIKVKKLPFEEYERLISQGNYQLFIGEIEHKNDFDPSFLLGNGNMFNYRSQDMENSIKEFMYSDQENKIEKHKNIQLIYMDDLPFVSLFFETYAMVISNKISNTGIVFNSNLFYNINDWIYNENINNK